MVAKIWMDENDDNMQEVEGNNKVKNMMVGVFVAIWKYANYVDDGLKLICFGLHCTPFQIYPEAISSVFIGKKSFFI